MKKILLICMLFLIASTANAKTLVVCLKDTTQIENQIAANWAHSGGAWYASYAQLKMGEAIGIGGVRGPMNNHMPHPHNRRPQLRYISLVVQDDRDRGEIEIDCQYLIEHNPEVFDRNYPSITSLDNIFWMKVFLAGSASQCRQVSSTTVTCS